MPLVLTEEQAMLRDAARGFLSEHAPIAHFRKLRDAKDPLGFSRDLWRSMGEMGWAGVLVPEAFGGSGLGYVEAGVILEEAGRTLTPSPLLSTAVVAATLLNRFGSDAQKQKYLPGIAKGEAVLALAVDEAPKHKPEAVALTATRSGNGFRLSGTKVLVLDGAAADTLIVAARTAGSAGETDGVTLFLVDGAAKGLARDATVLVDYRNAARLTLDNVEVDADAVLGTLDQGFGALAVGLDAGRAGLAAELVGSASQTFDLTVDYLKERKQFGRTIGEFQALQHRASHLFTELELARAASLKALQTLDAKPDGAGPIVSLAKAKAGSVAKLASQEGVQMFGGMGMTDDVDVGLFMKRIRVAQEVFGDPAFHADRIARLRGY
ncbi:acyl-CoA dehydrogenase family protein [Zavarzinia sp. CC-PAN008]|uniref:acyl-CoA dehydrogenase family protein n=1 Tax=Zavarzinia sp. CC-PAN008 TaxID=3243332 RepID=UPI003F744B7C